MSALKRSALALFLLCGLSSLARAHEARPAYLEIRETAPGRYDLLWRTPVLSGMRLPVVLKVPEGVRTVGEPTIQELTDSLLERRTIDAGSAGLAGKRIEFPGLQLTITDVLVRVHMQDGRTWTTIVRGSQPWVEIAADQTRRQLLGTYVVHGIRHILFGPDHLLFVFGLLLIVQNRWMLVKTVTAFTVAHSITLLASAAGFAPSALWFPPLIEVLIALSIVYMALENIVGAKLERRWLVAFGFGLVHGFGFSFALRESLQFAGSHLALSLVSFNPGNLYSEFNPSESSPGAA